jgi:hypothetical protein
MTGDQAFMYPMLEMAGNKRAKFTPFINYVYNCANPLNETKVNHGKQQLYARLDPHQTAVRTTRQAAASARAEPSG